MCMFCSLEHAINVTSCAYNMHTILICAVLCLSAHNIHMYFKDLYYPKGPICLLYDSCVKYDLNECLYNFMTGSSTLSKGEWKHLV